MTPCCPVCGARDLWLLFNVITGEASSASSDCSDALSPCSDSSSIASESALVALVTVVRDSAAAVLSVIGVIVFYLLQRYLADFGTWYLILLGVIAITIMLFAPTGLWGYVTARTGLVLFPTRRRLVRVDEDQA